MIKPFSAPLVWTIKFNDARSTEEREKNAAHVTYIGKRPGTDLGEERLEEHDESSGYGMSSDEHYAGYIAMRERSHGLFSSLAEGRVKLKDVKNELKQHKGPVWRMVISFKEEDAKRLNLLTRDSWEPAIRNIMPSVANELGIQETNFRWVAAMHQEPGHPHVHAIFWERKVTRRRGRLSKTEMKGVDRVLRRELYGAERVRIAQERTAARDLARSLAVKSVEEAIQEVQNIEEDIQLFLQAAGELKQDLAPKGNPSDLRLLADHLSKLSQKLPGQGRIAYQFMPEEAKQAAMEAVETYLKFPQMKEVLKKFQDAVEAQVSMYSSDPAQKEKAIQRALRDLKGRLANVMLRGAAEIQKKTKDMSTVLAQHPDQKQMKTYEKIIYDHQMQVAKNVWHSLWRGIDGARQREQAKSEMMKKRMQQRKRQREEERKEEREME